MLHINPGVSAAKIAVIKGPYFPSTSRDFTSINILTTMLKGSPPQVLIMMGPFITKHNIHLISEMSADKFMTKLIE